ncbi:MAG TPA: hypothetical protein VGK71_06375 [Nitrospirota bacterium]|jgi:hypothetical protein
MRWRTKKKEREKEHDILITPKPGDTIEELKALSREAEEGEKKEQFKELHGGEHHIHAQSQFIDKTGEKPARSRILSMSHRLGNWFGKFHPSIKRRKEAQKNKA